GARAGRRAGGPAGGRPRERRAPPSPGPRAPAPRARVARGRRRVSAAIASRPPDSAVSISLDVNGVRVARRVEPRRNPVDFLREDPELPRPPLGGGHGVCGACTVRVDGALVRGCLMLAAQTDGCRVETIEGVAASGEIRDLQQAFAEASALQCGFCTPAMLLTAHEILMRNPRADDREI